MKKSLLALLLVAGITVVGSVSARCGSCAKPACAKTEVIRTEDPNLKCSHTVVVEDRPQQRVERQISEHVIKTCPPHSTEVAVAE